MTTEYSIAKLTEMLQAKGIRPSARRIGVLGIVANSHRHPSAEDIYSNLEDQSVAIAHNGPQFHENADRARIAARIGP